MELLNKYEAVIRLSFLMGGFSLLALIEWLNHKRTLIQDKNGRWRKALS